MIKYWKQVFILVVIAFFLFLYSCDNRECTFTYKVRIQYIDNKVETITYSFVEKFTDDPEIVLYVDEGLSYLVYTERRHRQILVTGVKNFNVISKTKKVIE